ncbi:MULTISPECIES: envelope stress response membrane protein PspC [Pectobacterium]|uniref:envelope stress response membrane protein PspC n=1 Tax=Pectobacterium TaxID=122277 RepID=UPI0001A4433E|nr:MULTISPECIES: envelope stress response membrane protein PspC [Pectobacterium]KAA3668057.1 envelope stress response membrane protein PspC [Pectobacterium carotovorum subsp. carotovorum]KFX01224.1 transcriptional regulator [Pectobacterium carotovorum subsp. carotovorum]KHS84307.1 transcriptional regulator [Pectobacterium carotovorum subsp. carotovorum]KHT22757.1 transcriptional regulator [Pectobacterium carotovorum subsp. carotovorum]KHT29787.1 transcriptional regulator [Pectobacterium caroto
MKNTWSGKKLYRLPEEGMLKGVCAGLARYFDVPVKLVRLITVLSIFFGLFFFTVVAYIILTFMLDPAPAGMEFEDEKTARTPSQLLNEADATLQASEQRLRNIERYVTSDTFGVQNRFRHL